MKFNLHARYGALIVSPFLMSFNAGANALGHDVVLDGNDGIDVIWSVLSNGLMGGNRAIWETNQKQERSDNSFRSRRHKKRGYMESWIKWN